LMNVRELLSNKRHVCFLVYGGILVALAIIFLIVIQTIADETDAGVCGRGLEKLKFAASQEGYCPYTWATGLSGVRMLIALSNGDILAAESGKISVLWDDDGDGVSNSSERAVIANQGDLNHAIVIQDNFLYASSSQTVYRWPYTYGSRESLGSSTTIIYGIPNGGHSSRTLVIDSLNRLYVQVGSASNVDRDASRAAIRRFNLTNIPNGGLSWSAGEVFASGMRNEVGLRFDSSGGLWGVENGVDNVARDPWGDIHNDNPSEELNYFGNISTPAGKFYGYPYCFTEYIIESSDTPGKQWAHPDFMNDGTHTDAWCQNTSNVVPPAYPMPAHVAPLDILFHYNNTLPNINNGDAFVSWHGSWDRDPPQGYKVVRVRFANGWPVQWSPFLYYEPDGDLVGVESGVDTGNEWNVRPVGLTIGKCALGNCLFVSENNLDRIIAVGYLTPSANNVK